MSDLQSDIKAFNEQWDIDHPINAAARKALPPSIMSLSLRQQHLVVALAIMALGDDDNITALHIEAGDDLQDFDTLQLKLHETFDEARDEGHRAAVRVIDGNFD